MITVRYFSASVGISVYYGSMNFMRGFQSQWTLVIGCVAALLLMVAGTIFYQPTAAKTGALLIKMNQKLYVMDIDSLVIERVAALTGKEIIAPSPGCYRRLDLPCWVVVGETVYQVKQRDGASIVRRLTDSQSRWMNGAVSWSPDGNHVAYTVYNQTDEQTELRIHEMGQGETHPVAQAIDPAIAVAWSAECRSGLDDNCRIAYKTVMTQAGNSPNLAAINLSTAERRSWEISAEPIDELRWSAAGHLLYSRPERHFHVADDGTLAYQIPPGARLANLSPDGRYAVYYQSFMLKDCDEKSGNCLNLGVWLSEKDQTPRLIYNVDLSDGAAEGLNFIPTWSPSGDRFVFIQEGKVIHYHLNKKEATIWYQSLHGTLRSKPVFSPNREAIAFVDNQGEGLSEYRLVVVDPRLRPIEHIIETNSSFQLLAWLAD